jgi:cAMP-dependent protein kinase regulator
MTGDAKLIGSLARLGIFRDLSAPELETLVDGRDIRTFREGEIILHRGQENASLYFVLEGEAVAVIDDVQRNVLSRGSFFGEVSALLAEPASADIIGRSALQCLVIAADAVERFLVANPRIMFRMLQVEARRLRTADAQRT